MNKLNKCEQIAKIYYPRYEKTIKKNGISYQFELAKNNLQLNYTVYSSDYFLELNYKNELIARTGSHTINIYKNQNLNDKKTFTYSEKIVQCFTLSNGNYLLSSQDKNGIHTLVLVNENLRILKEQKVGLTSWHSQNSIAEANGIIIYGEYNVAKHPTTVSLYRSKDMGYSWEEVFILNAPDEIRHWHTLQYDRYSNSWLATSGDTPKQSRWFISKDDGENWNEITDKNFIEKINKEKSLSAHRTTCVSIDKDKYLWATDDLMGNIRDFFILENGERKTASKLYMSNKTEPLKIQKLVPLGIHIRSMVDIESGYILFSEGKYVTYNTQVFYIDKSDLTKPYFLFSLYSNSGHGGTYSINSSVIDGTFFIKHKIEKGFGTLKFDIKTLTKKTLQYSIKNYFKLEEHLWFLNKVNSIKNIIFYENSVKLSLSEKKDVFYMLLGDNKVDSFTSRKLFKVSKKQFGISVDMKKNRNFTSVKMYVQFFNDEKKISSKSYILGEGNNLISIDISNEEEKYLRVLFRIEHKQTDEVLLSNLSLVDNVDISKTIPETGSLQKKSLTDLKFKKKSNLLESELIYNEYVQYSFLVKNLKTDILTHFKKSDKLVVFYNGAVDINKTPPPVFQRWSWLKDLPYSAMIIMDPTIYELMKTNKATTYMGWYQGNSECFILEQYVELIKKIAKNLGVRDENILFYGSSVGGFASLMSAGMLKGSKACVVNPQTDVLKYYKKNVDICLNYLDLSYDNLKERKTTLNVMEFYKSINYFPQVYYKQNKQDELHYEKHFKEFQKLYKDMNVNNRLFVNLTDDSRGHSAIPRYDEGYEDILRTQKVFQDTNIQDNFSTQQIAHIYYPKKKLIEKNNQKLKYIFELDENYLELDVEGILKDKFLYADKKQLITRKKVDTFTISYDGGKTNKYEVKIKGLKIYQVYPLSNGYYLACGVTSEHKAYIYVFDKNLKELAKHQQGLMGWHSQDSIDEYKGILMYVEYQNFEKGAPLPKTISIFRSEDYGLTWKKVFEKKHPEEVRHGHTLQVDQFTGEWLVTFGDNPTQSRWFISKDNGDNWSEITDKTYKMKEFPTRSQCAHRTTSIKIDKDNYYWSTDDFMGNTKDYFTEFQGKRKTSSKIYKASKTQPLILEEMSNIGIHGRCMIDIGKGYIILTEAKYASFNMQVYYVSKTNLSKVYFLFDIYGYKRHSGPASMCSEVLNNNYFYSAIARTMFLNSDYQTLKWNFKYYSNFDKKIEYNIQDYIKLEEHLWFLNKTIAIDDISFFGNGVKLFLNTKKEPFYLLLDNPKVDLLLAKNLFKIDTTKSGVRVNLATKIDKNIALKMYIQFFDDDKKVFSQSYIMKNGFNSIEVSILESFKYFRVLFRIENKVEKKSIVELTDLDFQYIIKERTEIKKKNNIQNFTKQDSSISLIFLQKNGSTFKSFKPREDTKEYSLSFPLDWSVDPFNDRNWCFQLHAWRMMDPLLLDYSKSKKLELLKQCLVIMDDWKIYTFDQNKETKFTWYDMATGLRTLKLTYFANLIFNTSLENKIQDKTKENILFLLQEHIKVLKTQNIAMNNHGLFQLHGLIMASSLLKDKKGIEYGFEKINLLIDNQFYPDGFHVENSDKYHGFVLDIFKRIVKFSEYKNNKKLIEIIDKAFNTWKLTVFPNLEPLLIGDTDYKIRNIEFDKDIPNKYFMKYFQDSGYVFIRSTFSTKPEDASMLFFQTAYQNMTHRHSDDFNILLYEYGTNILVDAGQYSYDNSKERNYVLSTKAHNTVLIDNHDYDREKKLFYKSVLKTHKEENGIFILQTFLKRKDIETTHNRNIIYKPKEFLVVIDKLTSKKERKYSQYWHFHQDLEIIQDYENFISNINETNSMKIECSVFSFDNILKMIKKNDIDTQLYKGQTTPELQGWRSMKYKNLTPNFVLRNSIKSKNAILITKFLFNNTKLEINNLTPNILKIKSNIIEKEITITL